MNKFNGMATHTLFTQFACKCRQNERVFKTCTTVQVVEWNGNTEMDFMYNRKQSVGLHQFIFDVDQSQTHIHSFFSNDVRLFMCFAVPLAYILQALLAQMDSIESFSYLCLSKPRQPRIDVFTRWERCRFGV